MAYSIVKKDGKIKDFIQGVKDKRANKNVKFSEVVDNASLKQGGGLKPEFGQYATLTNRPFIQSTKIKYSVPRSEFKSGENSKIWKSTRRNSRATKIGKAAMAAGIFGMITS
jgi:hypothetical protein